MILRSKLWQLLKVVLTVLVLVQISGCELIWGCGDDGLRELTEESGKWTPYEPAAKLIFTHANSQDTVYVTSFQEKTELFIRGDECSDGRMQVIEAKLTSRLFPDTISFKVKDKDEVILENNDFFIAYRDSRKSLVTKESGKSYRPTLTIDNRTFTEAIISRCQTCDGLREIVFAKNEGLVAYKIEDVYWVRQK